MNPKTLLGFAKAEANINRRDLRLEIASRIISGWAINEPIDNGDIREALRLTDILIKLEKETQHEDTR